MEYDPKKYARKYGSRSEVYDLKTSFCTRGGLTAADLTLSRTGKIVSRKKQESARTAYKQFGFAKRKVPEEVKELASKSSQRVAQEPPKKRRRKRKKVDKVKNDM